MTTRGSRHPEREARTNPLLRRALLRCAFCAVLLLLTATAARAQQPPTDEGGEAATPPIPEEEDSEGLVARMGSVIATFRFFGDVGAGYDSTIPSTTGAKANFLAGTFDFFSLVHLSDQLRILSEVVAEFDSETNEVGFELERLWAEWSQRDAFYVKLGREHGPVSHWNRRYHHGRIFWPAVTQPFLARFEDQGGPLPIHQTGVEVGGTLHTGAGALGYVGVVSNGRGLERTEVTNVQDRDDTKAWGAGLSFAPSGLPGVLIGGNYYNDRIPADPAVLVASDTREAIVTIFGELRSEKWELIGEAANIDHEPVSSDPGYRHRSAYLQVNYERERWAPYARLEVRRMDTGDPFYIDADLDLDRWDGLVGVRHDLAAQAALKVEAGFGRAEERDGAGTVTTGDVAFAALGLQWVF